MDGHRSLKLILHMARSQILAIGTASGPHKHATSSILKNNRVQHSAETVRAFESPIPFCLKEEISFC